MAVSTVSPELTLVDPTLRANAIAALPHVEPYSFLHFPAPRPAPRPIVTRRRRPPVLVAASVYFVAALAKTIVVDAVFVAGLVGLVAGLQLAH
jgi:hypothetical protein